MSNNLTNTLVFSSIDNNLDEEYQGSKKKVVTLKII